MKQGDREGRVAVGGTPDDAFADQAGANGCLRADCFQQLIGDVPGAVWPRTQVCHGTQIPAFTGCGSFQPHLEDAFIESGDGQLGCGLHDIQSDRTGGGHIPSVFAPLLQKIRIALGFFQGQQLRQASPHHPCVTRRFN